MATADARREEWQLHVKQAESEKGGLESSIADLKEEIGRLTTNAVAARNEAQKNGQDLQKAHHEVSSGIYSVRYRSKIISISYRDYKAIKLEPYRNIRQQRKSVRHLWLKSIGKLMTR